jgi:hypothetical protein
LGSATVHDGNPDNGMLGGGDTRRDNLPEGVLGDEVPGDGTSIVAPSPVVLSAVAPSGCSMGRLLDGLGFAMQTTPSQSAG